METSGNLARHRRRIVDRFIESVLDELDLTDLELNVVGLAIRREVQEELVPGLAAVQALFHAADAATLGASLPQWLERVSTAIPADAGFLSEMGRRLDPSGCALLDESLGIRPGESEVGRSFEVHLWEMASFIPRGSGS